MSAPPYKVCPGCRQPSELHAQQCLSCGYLYPQQYPPAGYPPAGIPPYQAYAPYAVPPPGYVVVPPGTHSAGLAVLFSLLLLGGGQLYNRQVAKGLTLIFSYLGIGLASWFFLLITLGFGILIIGPLLLVFLILVSVDAYKIGERLNRGELVGQWQWF